MAVLAGNVPARVHADAAPAAKTDDRGHVRIGFYAVVITIGLFLGWAAITPQQNTRVVSGWLVATSQNKVLQHLDGGRVAEILVADGDRVAFGQPLLRLDARPLESELERIRGRSIELRASLERLTAERDRQQELVFSDALLGSVESEIDHGVLETQRALFESRRQAVISQKTMLEKHSKRATTQIVGLNRMVWSMRERAQALRRDFATLEEPNADRLASKTRLRELERRRVELSGEMAEREAEVSALRESIASNSQQLLLRQHGYRRQIALTLRDLQAELTALNSRRGVVMEKLARVEMTAPMAGRITGFDTVTTGAVIGAGAPIMEIVPPEPGYRVHARVSPTDVDELHPGMPAEVRLPAFNGARELPVIYAGLDDTSAGPFDSAPRDLTYHDATFALRRDGLDALNAEGVRLTPDMPVEVHITSDQRSFLDFLMRSTQDLMAGVLDEA